MRGIKCACTIKWDIIVIKFLCSDVYATVLVSSLSLRYIYFRRVEHRAVFVCDTLRTPAPKTPAQVWRSCLLLCTPKVN